MKQLALVAVLVGCCVALAACGDEVTKETGASSGGGASSSSSTGATGAGPGWGGNAESGGRGGTPPGEWDCLGSVDWPSPASDMVTVSAHPKDLVSGKDIYPVNMNVCAKADTDCAQPITTGSTNDGGISVTLTLPTGTVGFDGLLDVTSPPGGGGLPGPGGWIRPSQFFVSPPVVTDTQLAVPLLTEPSLVNFAKLANVIDGGETDESRGHLAIRGVNCALNPAEGLQISASTADASSKQVYIENMAPGSNAETDETGATIIFNVPAGPATVTARLANTGDTIGSIDIFVRAGRVNSATLPPTP